MSDIGFRYVQINDALWEVWDEQGLVCYQVGQPHEACVLIAPDVLEHFLAAGAQ